MTIGMENPIAIEIQNLTRCFGRTEAVRGLNLTVRPGAAMGCSVETGPAKRPRSSACSAICGPAAGACASSASTRAATRSASSVTSDTSPSRWAFTPG